MAVQDTTGVNYNTYRKTDGIGYISDKTIWVNVHNCLAITIPETAGTTYPGGRRYSRCGILSLHKAVTNSSSRSKHYLN
jgi:hypothetical protein